MGFDWSQISGPLEKVSEEFEEVRREWDPPPRSAEARARCAEELGDLLFALVNVARFQKFSPEDALRQAVDKFERRFRVMEESLRQRGRLLEECDLDELDRAWEQVKEQE